MRPGGCFLLRLGKSPVLTKVLVYSAKTWPYCTPGDFPSLCIISL